MKQTILNACATIRWYIELVPGYKFFITLDFSKGLVFETHVDYVDKNLKETLEEYGKILKQDESGYYNYFEVPLKHFKVVYDAENYWKEFSKIDEIK